MSLHRRLATLAALTCLAVATPVQGGLYYSGERVADLPSAWRGLLGDLRILRSLAVAVEPASSLRQDYLASAAELRALKRPLTADEAADLGALLVRLGQPTEALAVLRPAVSAHPGHFTLHANLGCAYQAAGDLARAAEALATAARLAPEPLRAAEALHLRLVRSRLAEPPGTTGLDRLFPAAPPAEAVALVQRLLFWQPADGRLLWQLAELAAARGDTANAYALAELCVGEFGLADAALRARRAEWKVAATAPPPAPPTTADAQKAGHEGHAAAGAIRFRSRRPLLPRPIDVRRLPPVRPDGLNPVAWPLLAETAFEGRRFKPGYHARLRELDGRRVEFMGYMQPITDDLETACFLLIENLPGCWYCEMPDATGIVLVELAPGTTARLTRGVVRVTGTLKLNAGDPEDFLFTLTGAVVGTAD